MMRPEATGEEAIAVADVRDVLGTAVGIPDATREAVAPDVQVVLGVAAHRRDAGGAAGHVNLAHILLRHGKHAVWVVVAQILLGGEGGLRDVGKGFHGIGVKASLIKEIVIERHILIALDDGLLDAFKLDSLQLLMRHREDVLWFLHCLPFLVSCGACAPLAACSWRTMFNTYAEHMGGIV